MLYTGKLIHAEAFTQRSFNTQKLLITQRSFYTEQAFTQRSFYTQQAFTQRSFYTEELFTQQAFTQRSFYTEQAFAPATHTGYTNCSSKTGSQRPSGKTTMLKHFLKGILKGKSLASKWRTFMQPLQYDLRFSAAKHHSTASTKKRESHLKPSAPLRAQTEHDSTLKWRRPHPSRTRANSLQQKLFFFFLPRITQCFVQIQTFKSHP